jgi:hypothetical protein
LARLGLVKALVETRVKRIYFLLDHEIIAAKPQSPPTLSPEPQSENEK